MNKITRLTGVVLSVTAIGCSSFAASESGDTFARPDLESLLDLSSEQLENASEKYLFGFGMGTSFACNPEISFDSDGGYSDYARERLEAASENLTNNELSDLLAGLQAGIDEVITAQNIGETCLIS